MNCLAYHLHVRHSALLLTLILLSPCYAQAPGAPPTGTVRPYTGPVQPPTAAPVVVGPRGFAAPGFAPNPSRPSTHHHDGGTHQHSPYPYLGYGGVYAYGVPYAYADDPNATDQGYDATDDSNYQGGPTVFDRRGTGAQSYVPPVESVPAPHAEPAADNRAVSSEPQPIQPLTVLVFKDGHKLEVGNYAIVGATLFDMTPGHPRKIALAELDLESTEKQNDDRGVVFQLPPSLQAN